MGCNGDSARVAGAAAAQTEEGAGAAAETARAKGPAPVWRSIVVPRTPSPARSSRSYSPRELAAPGRPQGRRVSIPLSSETDRKQAGSPGVTTGFRFPRKRSRSPGEGRRSGNAAEEFPFPLPRRRRRRHRHRRGPVSWSPEGSGRRSKAETGGAEQPPERTSYPATRARQRRRETRAHRAGDARCVSESLCEQRPQNAPAARRWANSASVGRRLSAGADSANRKSGPGELGGRRGSLCWGRGRRRCAAYYESHESLRQNGAGRRRREEAERELGKNVNPSGPAAASSGVTSPDALSLCVLLGVPEGARCTPSSRFCPIGCPVMSPRRS